MQPSTHTALDAYARLGHHIDDLTEELERTKQEIHEKDATSKNLARDVTELVDEVAELKRKLEESEAKNKVNGEARDKLVKLRSHWAGMADLFGPEVKKECEDDG